MNNASCATSQRTPLTAEQIPLYTDAVARLSGYLQDFSENKAQAGLLASIDEDAALKRAQKATSKRDCVVAWLFNAREVAFTEETLTKTGFHFHELKEQLPNMLMLTELYRKNNGGHHGFLTEKVYKGTCQTLCHLYEVNGLALPPQLTDNFNGITDDNLSGKLGNPGAP